jgi:hypothetical protein
VSANATVSDEMMGEPAAAEYLGEVPPATLRQWRYLGKGPAYVKLGRHVRYRKSDLDAFITGHRFDPGAVAAPMRPRLADTRASQ